MENPAEMRIRVVVAAHKLYRMPADAFYLPVQAGRAVRGALPYQSDAEGENISAKNPYYCELTCLYWAWKNLAAGYLGLCHYRRYFAARRLGGRRARILNGQQARALLQTAPVLLPKTRRYWIESNFSQYAHAHHGRDLLLTREILRQDHPTYLPAFDTVMQRTGGHHWNMFIMRRDLLDSYCAWLFDVLFALERRADITAYNAYDRRVFGFVGERLLDVWLMAHGVPYRELPVVFLESQHWPRKAAAFLCRKLRGGRVIYKEAIADGAFDCRGV